MPSYKNPNNVHMNYTFYRELGTYVILYAKEYRVDRRIDITTQFWVATKVTVFIQQCVFPVCSRMICSRTRIKNIDLIIYVVVIL